MRVYKANGTTESTAGVTDTEDFDSLTGVHHCRIDTSADAFYATGNDYAVVLAGALAFVVGGDFEGDFSVSRDAAFVAAGEPRDFGLEFRLAREVFRRRESDRQEQRAFIAVAGEFACQETGRHGEFHLSRLPTGREFPLDRGRHAGLAGIEPIAVPALVVDDADGGLQGMAGARAGGDGDPIRLGTAGIVRGDGESGCDGRQDGDAGDHDGYF